MNEQTPYVDPGHVLPDEDWAKVVARAREVREEILASAEGGASGPGGIVLDMTAMGVASKKYFGVSGIPTQLLVLHSAECPLKAGYAKSLSEWACGTVYPAAPIASWHRFVDPVHRVRLVPDELGAWHASEANVLSIGWEQAGYARYSREEWLSADGRVQLEMLAIDMAEVAVRDGIPARWLSNAEVRAVLDSGNRSIKGFCNHRQVDPETRTDPGNGYPYDLLMDRIKFYMGIPTPTNQEDTMNADQEKLLREVRDRVMGRDVQRYIGPNGEVSEENSPGYYPARSADLHDVLSLHNWVEHNANRVLEAVKAIPGIDVSVIEALGAELSAELKARMDSFRVTLAVEDPDRG